MTSFATNASRSEPVVGRRERNPVWHTRIMRFFNTTGPVRLDKHYGIPPLERLDLDEVLMLVRQERYFVLHALNLALVAKRRLAAAYHLPHRVSRQPQLPGNLLDRDALAQVLAADPRNRLHNQHLPPPRSSNQRGEFLPFPGGGSIFHAE